MLTPAIRAIQLSPRFMLCERRSNIAPDYSKINQFCKYQPWRCLWRGSVLQITLTTPLRLTILQLRQTFFTEARTFIVLLQSAPMRFYLLLYDCKFAFCIRPWYWFESKCD